MQELLQYCRLQDLQKAILEMKFFSRVLQKSCKNFGYESEFYFFCKNVRKGVFVSNYSTEDKTGKLTMAEEKETSMNMNMNILHDHEHEQEPENER
jgi:hypothetical protein